MAVMKNVPEEKIDPHCTGHGLAAIEQTYMKFRKGYATMGCILCLCARHEIVELNGVVDLDMGEKFWHTDYSINRWRFVIPKLHIKGHRRPCQEKFAFHLLPGGGQTDREGIERQWANLGPIGTNTREMGPGHRRETIDDHISACFCFQKRRAEAREQSEIHQKFFDEFTEGQQQAGEWLEMIQLWESGQTSANPYSSSVKVLSEQDVRLSYATKELESLAAGNTFLHDVSPSAFMLFGLDLEDQQRILLQDIKEENYNTIIQQNELMSKRAKIQRSIARFRSLQKLYTPAALTGVASTTNPTSIPTAETVLLLLPSGLPSAVWKLPEMKAWVEMETEFCRAQYSSALHDSVPASHPVLASLTTKPSRARPALFHEHEAINWCAGT
ncbi:hypothetical protein V5O48_013932 [Marasmius crinis-equi]|uniref:Uncharacterized protein n=1 Tax=Marasmius crinis-equi TaxID=585013 RepID=A0ABR3EYQ2_9AGAR